MRIIISDGRAGRVFRKISLDRGLRAAFPVHAVAVHHFRATFFQTHSTP
jgi:hypothetical protein